MNSKSSTMTNLVLASGILSAGVLSGCEYCQPLLLATIAAGILRSIYDASEALYKSMQIKSYATK